MTLGGEHFHTFASHEITNLNQWETAWEDVQAMVEVVEIVYRRENSNKGGKVNMVVERATRDTRTRSCPHQSPLQYNDVLYLHALM